MCFLFSGSLLSLFSLKGTCLLQQYMLMAFSPASGLLYEPTFATLLSVSHQLERFPESQILFICTKLNSPSLPSNLFLCAFYTSARAGTSQCISHCDHISPRANSGENYFYISKYQMEKHLEEWNGPSHLLMHLAA